MHSETQQPQLMQSDSLWITFIRSCEITVLLAVLRLVVARLEVRLHRLELGPERIHVDDEVLDDRQVPHRGDHGHVAGLAMSYIRVLQASTAAPSIRIPHEPQIIIRQLLR